MKVYAYNFFLKNFVLLASTFRSLIPIWVNFYIWCDVGGPTFFFFCMWMGSCHNTIRCKDFLSPFNCHGTLVENQLTIKSIEEYCHLNNSESSYPWTWDVFHMSGLLYFFSTIFFSFQSISFTLLLLNQWLSFCCCFH